MGALAKIVSTISDEVVAQIAYAGYPALSPGVNGETGKIWVGTAAVFENLSAPRIVFEPVGSEFRPAEFYNGRKDAEAQRFFSAMRPILTDAITFKVHCWGKGDNAGEVDDFDATHALYQLVLAVLQKTIPGAWRVAKGSWTPVGVNHYGREFTFSVTIDTPVLDSIAPYYTRNESSGTQQALDTELHAPVGTAPNGGSPLAPNPDVPGTGLTLDGENI